MRAHRIAIALTAAFLFAAAAGCGGENGGEPAAETAAPLEGPEGIEASPGEDPVGPEEQGELSGGEEAEVADAVREYVAALNARDAAAVCAHFEPGALELAELPARRGTCAASLSASIGARPKGGAPAWRSTRITGLKEVSVGEDRARVTATVTHRFSDRDYVSVEDDVIYLDRSGDEWLLAKPSATLYRAVGYPEPPIRSFAPPSD